VFSSKFGDISSKSLFLFADNSSDDDDDDDGDAARRLFWGRLFCFDFAPSFAASSRSFAICCELYFYAKF
jgi:hypothetical protein